MANNKISVLIDVTTREAARRLGDFRRDLADTDGAFGKLKLGGKAAFDGIKANVGEFAVAAGAAIVGFGAKAVGEFQNVALEAGKFSEAAGLSVEDASRWIEVAGDLGIEAGTVEGAIAKMNIELGKGKLDEFADEIVRTKDGRIDASATFVNIATAIGAIEDPTKQALAAQQAFGKGYRGIAELMAQDAGMVREALASVSDEKVIDEQELENAREFRAALDELKDAVDDVVLRVGGALVPILTEVAETIGKASEAADRNEGKIKQAAGAWRGFLDQMFGADNLISGVDDAFDKNSTAMDRFKGGVQILTGVFPGLGEATQDWADDTVNLAQHLLPDLEEQVAANRSEYLEYQKGMRDAEDATDDLAAAQGEARRKAMELKDSISDLRTELGDRKTYDDYIAVQGEMQAAALEAWTAAEEGSEDAATKLGDYNTKLRDEGIPTLLDFIETAGGIPTEAVTEVKALIAEGDYQAAYERLLELSKPIVIDMSLNTKGLGGVSLPGTGPTRRRATGGQAAPFETFWAGERGPELIQAGSSGAHVTPNHRLGGMGGGGGSSFTINVTAGMGADGGDIGRRVVEAIKQYERQHGRVFRAA